MGTSEQPTEDELRAAYEAEMARLRVEQVLLESVVSLVNLGMRRTGLAPGTEAETDAGQVYLAIESVRALLPIVEQVLPEQAGPIRDAVSQLQLAFVKIGGPAATGAAPSEGGTGTGGTATADPETAAPPAPPAPPVTDPSKPGDPGPAQRSGRLWIPGQ
ncbi:MAG TPA: hypothetical protein VG294_06355 [Solirubrobacteraceae bacterium]|nr:hypothetical protein [Solirubrobacteraceae bacterium]